MNSAFFEFNVATSALFTAKNSLSVVSNNIANSSVKGYSRQVAQTRSSIPLPGTCGVGMIGTGSEVYGIEQIRDFYLDKKYWEEQATYGEYSEKNDQLELVETIFDELSTSGISASVESFFDSITNLTFDSNDTTYRTSVINIASAFVDTINSYSESLKSQQRDINDEIETVVKRINAISDQVSALNKEIFYQEIDGNKANELRDERALLIDELSKYVNTEVKEISSENGKKFMVLINGQTLVSHFDNEKLNCVARDSNSALDKDDAPGLYDLAWSGGGSFGTSGLSGTLKGLFDVRDGNVISVANNTPGVQNYKGIPYYVDRLNTLVQTIARAFNEGKYLDGTDIEGIDGHINGYDAEGNQGNLFFSYKGEDGTVVEDPAAVDYSQITASNFSMSDLIMKDSKRLAASTSGSTLDKSNNEVILQFTTVRTLGTLFKEGNVFDFMNGVSTELAIDKRQSDNFEDFYEELTTATDNQRVSVSGVSLNEELTEMIKNQQLFVASSKLIQSISKVYDTLINQLGL